MLSVAAVSPLMGPQLRDLSLDLSDLWYVDRLPAVLGHCTALTALHLQWMEGNQQGMAKVRNCDWRRQGGRKGMGQKSELRG